MIAPIVLEVLVSANCTGRIEREQAPAVRDTIAKLTRDGILARDEHGYDLTGKGRAWLRLICDTPYPKQAWVDAQGNVVPE